ncbi:hypothetical protein Q7P37_001588 [Cladosporium fusiforme]
MDTSYLSQQVTTIIERLHNFFDEIGVPTHERDSRESELFSALSETLHNQLNHVAKEKHDLTEEAKRLITTIRSMERAIDDTKSDDEYETEQEITYPLLACIQNLKERHHTVAKLHRERFEQVRKLAEALESYASHLEPSFLQVKLPPADPNAKISPSFDLGPKYVASLDTEFTRVYEEYNKRLATVQQTSDDIINLWSELGTPQAQVDSRIVQFARDAPEQLGLHQEDLKRLVAKRDKLISEKSARERKLKDLKESVEGLWDRLGVEDAERRQFLAANRGCGLRQINEFEDELARLNELKHQNLHIFVEDARLKLQALWDSLYFAEEEMLEFTPAFSDVYSDALLSAHEQEIARLEMLKEQRMPILAVIDRHRSLIQDREDLEKSSQDASRLMAKGAKGERRDPGKLLREEKQRKRITKELPKVESDLRKTLEQWEDEYGRPFCVHGQRYLDELDARSAKTLPPRSKTPNALPPSRDGPKSASRAPPSRSRADTLRGQNPTRSKTPTGGMNNNSNIPPSNFGASVMGNSFLGASTMGASTMGSSVSRPGHSRSNSANPKLASPSKLPPPSGSRLPMSNLRDGNNSPERKLRPATSSGFKNEDLNASRMRPATSAGFKNDDFNASRMRPATASGYKTEDFGATIRSSGPLAAPPPKMKSLYGPPTPSPHSPDHFESERSSSVVRHSTLEDPYDESAYRSYLSNSVMGPPPRPSNIRATPSHESYLSSTTSAYARPMSRQDYPLAPPSRAPSNTSSTMTGSVNGSGSENWETYTDASDTEEADATEAYYARKRAQQQQSIRGAASVPVLVGGGGSIKRTMQSPYPRGVWERRPARSKTSTAAKPGGLTTATSERSTDDARTKPPFLS